MKHKIVRISACVLDVFVALTAIAGGIGLLTGGITFPLAWLQGTPISDYTIPGMTLAILVGGSSFFAAATIFIGREVGVLASALAGLIMIGFEVVEVAIIDHHLGNELALAIALQAGYSVAGLAMFGLAAFLWMTENHHHYVHTRHISQV